MQKRRENQKWVSHNKVLIGSGDGVNKKPHARNPNFDSEETKLLIQLWGNKDVQRQLITVHKKHPVISKIAEKMRVYGYNRSTEEINTRIKNLKCLYNRIKKDLDSGLLNEPSWKHFQSMDEILSRPVFGNSSSNKHPLTNKIIISPSSTSTNLKSEDQHLSIYHLKEEEMSDDDDDDEEEERSSMDLEGSELRPEDLLSVIETEHEHDVQIKEEPMDDSITIIETKTNEKPDADSSTDLTLQNDGEQKIINSTSLPLHANKTNSIINYANEALSITSVHGNNTMGQETSTKLLNQSSNKISLVPTKLLLKSQGTLSSFKSASHVVVPTSVNNNLQTQSSSSVPMKVVFVNALNSNHNTQQSIAKQQVSLNKSLAQLHAQGSNSTFITNKLIQNTSQQQITCNQLLTSNSTTSISSSTSKTNSNNINTNQNHHHQSSGKSNKSLLGNSKLPVIRNLLTNIVDIENQRLEIEKQRFEYEKKVGNEILLLIKSFVQHLPHEKPKQMDENETPK
ncbi:probable myosin light chain kinase DDB_G0279831 [Chironomus tepperi]|uniref:probable myosin light chain kinase DDB_G0279831 n=1 Tax=Chironomus tepperi TaxID=113505 RepID=UPI00391F0553